MKTFIYVLMEPTTEEIRYVGKSINPEQRYRKHINEAKTKNLNNHKINWIKSLLKNNLKPKMVVIDSIEGEWIWLEEFWISQFLTWGFNLVNSTNGGENPPSWKGRTHSDEYKKIRSKLMSINNPSKQMTDEWRQNISIAHKKNGFIPNKASESNKIKVNQYSLNNEFIKTWNSITEAAKAVGLKRPTGISAVCNNKRNKAGGFKWSYN